MFVLVFGLVLSWGSSNPLLLCALVSDNCQLMLALKLLSASILGPSVFLLRGVIFGKYPYKDLLDNWEVTVIINEQYDNHVEMNVMHSRKEKALIPEPNQHFEFDWKSTIVWTSSP